MTEPKTSTVNRVRTPHDDVVDAWWSEHVTRGGVWKDEWTVAYRLLLSLSQQPEAVQRGVLRKARGQ